MKSACTHGMSALLSCGGCQSAAPGSAEPPASSVLAVTLSAPALLAGEAAHAACFPRLAHGAVQTKTALGIQLCS